MITQDRIDKLNQRLGTVIENVQKEIKQRTLKSAEWWNLHEDWKIRNGIKHKEKV
jgi:hypothetical protein